MRTLEIPKAKNMPFQLVGPDKGLIAGFDTEAEANADAAERNGRAAGMGLKARYAIVANPPA